MNRTEKEQVISELQSLFGQVESVVLTNPIGLDVNTINELRSKCRAEGVEFRVVKNTLARRALKDTDMAALSDSFAGPTAIALKVGDPVTPAKILTGFAKDHDKFQIKAGYLSGRVLDEAGVESLSKMKSLPEMRAELLSIFNAPQRSFVGVCNTMVTQVLGLLKARADKMEEAA